ncbi:MAG: hypothetical protein Q9160_005166 [Pyrenula sp. 1 TL-2023]
MSPSAVIANGTTDPIQDGVITPPEYVTTNTTMKSSIDVERRVIVISTGGTICMVKSPDGLVPNRNFLANAMAPRTELNDGMKHDPIEVRVNDYGAPTRLPSLRTPLSIYGKQIRYTVLEFEELLDSSSIDAKGWTEIAEAIYRNYELFDAFVVLHGTDSLAYTCSALSFMCQNLGKPVIFTGSQVPMSERKNDALENLIDAIDIAGHFVIPEVCLLFDSHLYRGNRCSKVSANAFNAFGSPNLPPLAKITAMDTEVAWDLVCRSKSLEKFSIQTNVDTNHVACLRIFPGIKPAMVDAVLRTEGLRGLVLETFGAGNAPSGPDHTLTKVFQKWTSRGIVIVNITQCLTGSVSPVYATGVALGRAGVVPGGDMTCECALAKLSYLLSLPKSTPEQVRERFSIALRGEITEGHRTVFRHPSPKLSFKKTNLTAVHYAIADGNIAKVKDILRNENGWLLNQPDYSGNTPLHLAATGPSLEILRFFLTEGASVHMRNYGGRTPLFLSANAGLGPHVDLLRRSGAHL